MNTLDLVLILAVVGFAIAGYRRGFIVGVLSFAGFLGGGVLGMFLVPRFVERFEPGPATSLVAILVVLLAATLGQMATTVLGAHLRQHVTWEPAKVVDATAGAVLSAVSVLLVAWLIGLAVASASVPVLTREASRSQVLQAMDGVMPPSADKWFSSFTQILDENGFPQVFAPFTRERIVPVEPPDPSVRDTRAVQVATQSVVKVLGSAPDCGRELEGSGFVYAPGRVMTNAHVVAGVSDPIVLVAGRGTELDARVVLFDTNRDVAVLYVPDLDAPALDFNNDAGARDDAVVAGFPRNGGLTIGAARIRSEIDAQGPDIYRERTVTREVFSLYADVQPGNSGGPLLAPDGDVYGVIFAKSLDDDDTGYALTADEVAGVASEGAERTEGVDTNGCA